MQISKQHKACTVVIQWHDNQWPWVSLTWQLYNLQLDDISGADFENSLYIFSQLEKR